jgi:hypothetical protein
MAYGQNYNYTVDTLLREARRRREPGCDKTNPNQECDHIIELQLVVAALNRLPSTTFNHLHDWQRTLVDFFQQDHNFQPLTHQHNQEKGRAITRLISGERPSQTDLRWIQKVKNHWMNQTQGLLLRLGAFLPFVNAMNSIFG